MARYNFNLRSPSSSRPSAIHLVIRYNGHRVVFPTGEHIHPKYWESDKSKRSYQRAKKSLVGSPELNHRLEQIEIKARNVFRTWLVEHDEALPAPQELLSALNDAFKRNNRAQHRYKLPGLYQGLHSQFQFPDQSFHRTPTKRQDHLQVSDHAQAFRALCQGQEGASDLGIYRSPVL